MESLAATALLIAALILPIASYWLLRARLRMTGLAAAAIAVVMGWALNVAWASVVAEDSSQDYGDVLSIAAYFGWACPSVLVLLTWLVWRQVTRPRA